MDLRAHLDWAQAECEFIGDLLHKEGMKNILQTCLDLGSDGLQEQAKEYEFHIERFFRTPMMNRNGFLTGYPDDQARHAFLLAALHKARCALFLHEMLYASGASRWPDEEMGKMLLQFAETAESMEGGLPQLSPFYEDALFGMSPQYLGRIAGTED